MYFFFFKQKTAYEMRISDWSSDVCSSDLASFLGNRQHRQRVRASLGRDGRTLQRIERDVDPWPLADRIADLFPDIQHRRFVALAFANDHRTVVLKIVEIRAHGLYRRSIDRKIDVWGKVVSVTVDLGGR